MEKAQKVPDAGRAGARNDDHGWRPAVDEWRLNWRLGFAAFLIIGLSHGAYQALSSLFVLPLQEAFGWSRGQIAFAHYSSLVVAIAAPFVGRAVDRFGPRRIMLGGMTLSILIYLGLSSMNGSLTLFYVLSVLAGVIGLSASGLTCSRVISQSFVRSRGVSLAIARSGLALASAVLPTILFAIIARYGWRAGYMTEALLVLTVALPAAWFWIGHSATPAATEQRHRDRDLPTWLHLLRERRIWLLCLGAGLGYAPATAIMTQLQPLLISKGVEAGSAAALVGMADHHRKPGRSVLGARHRFPLRLRFGDGDIPAGLAQRDRRADGRLRHSVDRLRPGCGNRRGSLYGRALFRHPLLLDHLRDDSILHRFFQCGRRIHAGHSI